MPKLPNFFIIGAPKCGSTWLAKRLAQHPQIFMVLGTYYFDKPEHYAKGLDWYGNFFLPVRDEIAIGDKTPSWLWGRRFDKNLKPTDVPQRVRKFAPSAKILVTLRNPINRAISHFHHAIRAGRISPFQSIDSFVAGNSHPVAQQIGLLECGLYYRQLKAWREVIPPENIRVLIQEIDIAKNPVSLLQSICEFLQVDSSFKFNGLFEKEHAGLSKTELFLKYYAPPVRKVLKPFLNRLPNHRFTCSAQTQAFLASYYAAENQKLADLLNRDLSCWNAPRAVPNATSSESTAPYPLPSGVSSRVA